MDNKDNPPEIPPQDQPNQSVKIPGEYDRVDLKNTPPPTTSKDNKSLLLTAILVLLSVSLIVLGILAYLDSTSQSNKSSTDNNTSETVQASDLQDTTSEIDASLDELNSAQDFADDELSDDNLGL